MVATHASNEENVSSECDVTFEQYRRLLYLSNTLSLLILREVSVTVGNVK